ncbi:MAG: FHA domain-containing protein [Butyrivibrio sp.]|nr:FHA domain-containing protein [Butyrivibrio sp.]
MKMTRCQGSVSHFFDGDKYSECPICKAKALVIGETAAAQDKPEKPSKPGGKIGKLPWGSKHRDKDDARSDLTQTASRDNKWQNDIDPIPKEPPSKPSEQPSGGVSGSYTPNIFDDPYSDVGQGREQQKKPASQDEGKTIGFYNSANSEPVVGWLICIKGESIGECFKLKAGKNSVGRGTDMDVSLAHESTVSRVRHAILIYEPVKRIFIIQTGDADGLVYLNNELLMSHAELKSRDIIKLGEALLMFYPLCGEDFSWDDYIEK